MSNKRDNDDQSLGDPEEQDLLGGRYIKVREIGSGGSGTVYEALHHLTQERVAVKIIDLKTIGNNKRIVARFMREAKLSHRIKHSGVVRVTDAWIDDHEGCCLVMELLRGMSFRDAIQSRRATRYRALQWLMEALGPLEAAHHADIIHRDLKPENIYLHQLSSSRSDTLITSQPVFFDAERGELRTFGNAQGQKFSEDDSFYQFSPSDQITLSGDSNSDSTDIDVIEQWDSIQVKLLDFGLSRSSFSPSVTQTGHFVGTPWYMSPEQIFTPKSCEHTADLWSMGVILYEILTDQVPFTGESMPELCLAVRDHALPSIIQLKPDLPQELVNCVELCLEKDPQKRAQSASQIKHMLTQALPKFASTSTAQELLSGSMTDTPSTHSNDDHQTVDASMSSQIDESLFKFDAVALEPNPTLPQHQEETGETAPELDVIHTPPQTLRGVGAGAQVDQPPQSSAQAEFHETIKIKPLRMPEYDPQGTSREGNTGQGEFPQTVELTSGVVFEALLEEESMSALSLDATPVRQNLIQSSHPQLPLHETETPVTSQVQIPPPPIMTRPVQASRVKSRDPLKMRPHQQYQNDEPSLSFGEMSPASLPPVDEAQSLRPSQPDLSNIKFGELKTQSAQIPYTPSPQKRWGLWLLLMLSVGVLLGLILSYWQLLEPLLHIVRSFTSP